MTDVLITIAVLLALAAAIAFALRRNRERRGGPGGRITPPHDEQER